MGIDSKAIILKYYDSHSELFNSLWVHSFCVMQKAIKVARESGIDLDIEFVKEASLLHDIGIFKCNAPSIYCYGELPYICHGICGKEILEKEGLIKHALVCERHTGAGLSKENIISQKLPLPQRDMLPMTIEEKLICYADKFFSKSGNLTEEKNIDAVIKSIKKHGVDVELRFNLLHEMFKRK